jgi:hypothetical protein
MTPLFTKLNLGLHRDILVLNAPESFETELAGLSGVTIRRQAGRLSNIQFALAFVTTLAEVELATTWLPRTQGDPIVWFVYPKGTSKRLTCEFNRDTGWDAVRAAGFDTVRQVAIDEDWTALRFRRIEHVNARTSRKPEPLAKKPPEKKK